jgi:hypothetical protein
MGTIRRDQFDTFAAAYNNTGRFPSMSAVATHLGIAVKTAKNTASLIRRLALDGHPVPELISRAGKAAEAVAIGEDRTIETVPPASHEPVEELIRRAIVHNERVAASHEGRRVIDVSIKVKGPFGVVGLPDHHLNNVGTLLRRAFHDADTIASHPALFCAGIGDWLDNFIVGRLEKERRKDIMSHTDSWRMLEHYLHVIAPKLIGGISGNHMDWTASMGGVDVMRRLFEEHGLGPLYDTDELRVRLISPNGVAFTHFLRHKYPGHSKYNVMHGILVWMLERWQGEDVFWGGHIHTAGHCSIEKAWMGERRVIHGVQLAAYKDIDQYQTAEGFRRNVPFLVPMVVHDPDTGETAFFDDMHKGIKYLDLLRAERGLS